MLNNWQLECFTFPNHIHSFIHVSAAKFSSHFHPLLSQVIDTDWGAMSKVCQVVGSRFIFFNFPCMARTVLTRHPKLKIIHWPLNKFITHRTLNERKTSHVNQDSSILETEWLWFYADSEKKNASRSAGTFIFTSSLFMIVYFMVFCGKS